MTQLLLDLHGDAMDKRDFRLFCNRCNAEIELPVYCRRCGCPEFRIVGDGKGAV
jgi:primosomal protein N'